MDSALASLLAKMYACNARVESMKALNQHRLSLGESIAYDEEAFYNEAQQLEDIARQMAVLP